MDEVPHAKSEPLAEGREGPTVLHPVRILTFP